MMRLFILFTIIYCTPFSLFSQINYKSIAGTYSDALDSIFTTELILKSNGEFTIQTVDEIYPYTYEMFKNNGVYIISNDSIILNPGIPRPLTTVDVKVGKSRSDTLYIDVKYMIDKYKRNRFIETADFRPKTISIYVNDEKNYTHIMQEKMTSVCLFSPKIKNQIVLNDGILKLSKNSKYFKKALFRIGVYSYGFDEIKWFPINREASNVEFKIHQPVEIDRMPINREILIDKKRLFYYRLDGKIDKGLTPLEKKG